MRAVATIQGGTISQRQWEALGRSPSYALIKQRFGGWQAAWQKAGVPARPRQRWTREALVQRLREVASLEGGPLTLEQWVERGYEPSTATAYKIAPWSELWAEAGYPLQSRWTDRRQRRRWTDVEILAVMKWVAGVHGGPISQRKWTDCSIQPCVTTVRNHFGPWGDAWERAGFHASRRRTRRPWWLLAQRADGAEADVLDLLEAVSL